MHVRTPARTSLLLILPFLLAPAPAGLAEDSAPPPAPPVETAAPAATSAAQRAPDLDAYTLERRERRLRAAVAAGADSVLLVLSAGASRGFTGRVRSDDFFYLSPVRTRGAAVVLFSEPAEPATAADPGEEGEPDESAKADEPSQPDETDKPSKPDRPDEENEKDEQVAVRQRIYLPPRRPALERWNGRREGPGEETAARHGFDAALPVEHLGNDLAALLATRTRLLVSAAAPADGRERLDALLERVGAALPPGLVLRREDVRRRPVELPQPAEPATGTAEDASEEAPAVEVRVVRSARGLLTDLRATKSPAEIERIRHAVEATGRGIRDVLRCARPGLGEFQMQGIIEFHCRAAGCDKQAFDSIVGSGPNSCVLHYRDNTRIMEKGDIVVLDVGGEFDGYAADVTRTFPVSGRFTDEQAEVYDAVLAAQEAALAEVRPGVTLGDVHKAARAVLAERGLGQYFIHGTSHAVGLNVHDVWGRSRKLVPGSVLTVEPGVYIAEKNLGVRIEDTVLVLEDGYEILSTGLPKTRKEVEALMRKPATFDLSPPR